MIYSKIGRLHNSTVGHIGVGKYRRQHANLFIDHSSYCQQMNVLKISIHFHGFTTSTYSRIDFSNIDFTGSFPNKGYILVITFTRWVESYAIIDATAELRADCLLQHFGRFGTPRQLRSDRGPHLIAEVIELFLTLVDVEDELTLAYSKEENAMTERANKDINRHLRALTFDNLSLDN